MKVFRVVVQIINFDGLSEEEIVQELENASYANDCISPKVRKIESREIGEWRDDHPLNMHATAQLEFEKLFS